MEQKGKSSFDSDFQLTPAGRELEEVVQAVGRWGVRWVPELGEEDLDPHLLMWDVHRNLDLDAMPPGRTVLKFCFPDRPGPEREWWIVVSGGQVDVCDADPGFDVRLTLESPLRVLVRLWRGDLSWAQAERAHGLRLHGDAGARRAAPYWLKLSPLAPVARP